MIAAVAVAVLAIPAAAWFAQQRLIFFPQPVVSTAHLPPRAAPFAVTAADGTQLRGWIVPGSASPAQTIVYFGGNAEEVSWTLADARFPGEWSRVAFNYRGYGESEGTPGERALLADGLAIHDTVAAHDNVDRTRIVVFGRSLGTAVAAHVAAHRPVAGVVLVSPYDSIAAVGSHHYPWLPVSLLLRHRFEATRDARRASAAMLAIVASSDSIIPNERSRALYDAWAGPKRWLVVDEADHNTLGATREFWEGVAQFLAEVQRR
ncbi:MAG: alpha/beta hydrolase [Burkholderiales bacterium]|nr:alpha/beta hydrolase [Burkholderiales bacterium]